MENRHISLQDAAEISQYRPNIGYIFTDAAGAREVGGLCGIGGISYSLGFAYQIPRHVFMPLFRDEFFRDSRGAESIIAQEELLGQIFSVWYLFMKFPKLSKFHVALHVDNTVAGAQFRRGRARYELCSFLIGGIKEILRSKDSIATISWIDTERMKSSGADALSRIRMDYIAGLSVDLISASTFGRFVREVFPFSSSRCG